MKTITSKWAWAYSKHFYAWGLIFTPAFPVQPDGNFISNTMWGLSVYGFSTQCTNVSSRSKIIVFLFSYPIGRGIYRDLVRIYYMFGRGKFLTYFSDYKVCIMCNFRSFWSAAVESQSCMDLSFVIYSFMSLGFLSRNVFSKGFCLLVN